VHFLSKTPMSQILPYQLEPEYSSTEERSGSEEEEEEDDSLLGDADTGVRRLDTSWCLCERFATNLFGVKSRRFCRKWLKV